MISRRSIASRGRRAFGIGILALSGAWALHAPPVSASSMLSLGVKISRESTGREFLVVRGGSVDSAPTGEFSITAGVFRVPCPGRYKVQAEGENQLNGVSSTYTAAIALSRFSPRPATARCGVPLPLRPGSGTVDLVGESELLSLSGSRAGTGNFQGRLTLRELPQCEGAYTLSADFDLQGWRRTYDYRLSVLSVVVTQEGVVYPSLGCG